MIAVLAFLAAGLILLALLRASSGRLCGAAWTTLTLTHHCGHAAGHAGAHLCACGARHTKPEGVLS